MSTVSIVIPAYQAEGTIRRAVESCLGTNGIEVIVVDDGSRDCTGELAEQLSSRYAHVRVIHTVNKGRSHARNTGIEEASAGWVMFVDADDTLLDGALEAIEYAVKNARGDLVIFCSQIDGDEKLSQWASRGLAEENDRQILLNANARDLLSAMIFGGWRDVTPGMRSFEMNSCWARLYRRDKLLDLADLLPEGWGPFPEGVRLSEDRLLNLAYLSLLGDEPVEFMPYAIYCWDLRSSGTVATVRADDSLSLESYRAHLLQLVDAGFMTSKELAPLYAREVAMQFRRSVQAVPDGPTVAELYPYWERALSDKESRQDLLSAPSDCLGDGGIWRGALNLLSRGHVKAALSIYRAAFDAKKLLKD